MMLKRGITRFSKVFTHIYWIDVELEYNLVFVFHVENLFINAGSVCIYQTGITAAWSLFHMV